MLQSPTAQTATNSTTSNSAPATSAAAARSAPVASARRTPLDAAARRPGNDTAATAATSAIEGKSPAPVVAARTWLNNRTPTATVAKAANPAPRRTVSSVDRRGYRRPFDDGRRAG